MKTPLPQHTAIRWNGLTTNVTCVRTLLLFAAVSCWLTPTTCANNSHNDTFTTSACYGTVNAWLRLKCKDDKVIKVLNVFQGAKLINKECHSPATRDYYKKECCLAEPSDCRIDVQDLVSINCNGHPQCDFVAMWSVVSRQCDQDEYPSTTTYMATVYTCVPPPASSSSPPSPSSTQTQPPLSYGPDTSKALTKTPPPTNVTKPTDSFVVVSSPGDDRVSSHDELTGTMTGAIIAGAVGMVLTFIIFVFYWTRKRRLRIVGKPQTTVWDYLLSQTFTVRGERGYDHFSSCRSSASSDGESNKSPIIRKNIWLPNISPMEDTQSNVFNDSELHHNLEFHQIGTASPYAVISLGVDSASTSAAHHDA